MTTSIFLLWLLAGLFFLRVLGQAVVMAWHPRWLPPPRQWYSGLIPYGPLLGFQILILALMAALILGMHPGIGPWQSPSPFWAKFCMVFSVPYFGFMIYRWIFRVWRNPARRWYDTLIPILFHCLLATFLWIYGTAALGA